MDLLIFAALVIGVLVLKNRDQRQRIVLLGSHLARYDIEKLMEGLTEGYLRALGEADAERQAQVWSFWMRRRSSCATSSRPSQPSFPKRMQR